jgi:UDP-N-acetylglucosamine 1-carboxyvinyltransferase
MDKLVIEGGAPLKGQVKISGAKNSVLPILAASLLTDEQCIIKNVPDLQDVHTMLRILNVLGAKTEFLNNQITVIPKTQIKPIAPYKLVCQMRGSFCVLGPLLAKLGKARVSLPGGCVIGVRPVDLHIKGLVALGAKIKIEGGDVVAQTNRLRGRQIYLGGLFGSSVLATANIMMAATLAQGKTIIECAACEPEVVDLANFLIKMGARIKGQGTPSIEIDGVKRLSGAMHKVIPDRIETITFMIAAAITKGTVEIKDVNINHFSSVVDKLREIGVEVKLKDSTILVKGKHRLKPVNVTTLPYPGFPTDAQAQIMSLLTITPGISIITEKIFPDRFMHIAELNRMGANIQREGFHAIIEGRRQLFGAPVMASDLRASAALVLAGLVAKGKTEISRLYHLERGYENLDKKLQSLGAKIWREKE